MSKRAGVVRRLGGETVAGLARSAEAAPLSGEVGELESSGAIVLPRDHPKWVRDRFTITAATKAWLGRIKPIVIRVFSFWDHRVHRLTTEDGTIEIDVSGSYRSDSSPSALEKRLG
jgi:hypothetical protein